jgi:AbrB family looped-hinge helix DNA binding protein
MATYAVKMEQSGRIVLPAELRKKLDLKPGEDVLIQVEDDKVTILGNRMAAIRKIQELLRPYRTGHAVDDLIADRRAEAAAEENS